MRAIGAWVVVVRKPALSDGEGGLVGLGFLFPCFLFGHGWTSPPSKNEGAWVYTDFRFRGGRGKSPGMNGDRAVNDVTIPVHITLPHKITQCSISPRSWRLSRSSMRFSTGPNSKHAQHHFGPPRAPYFFLLRTRSQPGSFTPGRRDAPAAQPALGGVGRSLGGSRAGMWGVGMDRWGEREWREK